MDAWIDPASGGYQLQNGAPLRDMAAGLANAVYLRLMTPLGSYWADPQLGSRLHELQRHKDVGRVAMLARQYAEQALAPLLADGRATAVAVESERPGNGRLHLRITLTTAGGERL
ncbi:phage GP46 family protein, partial [Chitinivorax sp. PXF-14]|uniref:phage GP46 family protein n=1 Tax=Chitinivorax sp. PXF-14 TaxID=3230488 RepID=UPI00346747A6